MIPDIGEVYWGAYTVDKVKVLVVFVIWFIGFS